jgi:outer membrane protein LpxR
VTPPAVVALAMLAASPNLIEPPPMSGAAFFLEEDALNIARQSDQNYTGGGAIQVSGLALQWATVPLQGIDLLTGLQKALDALDQQEGRTYRGYSLALGLTVFTPKDLTAFDPIPVDRPYASLDFLTAARTSAFDRLGWAITTELTVAVLGMDQGHQLQKLIHEEIRAAHRCADEDPDCVPHDPKGWRNQISFGGEPTARYGLLLEHRAVDARAASWARFDLKGVGRLDLGYYTGASFGFAFRAGLFRTPFWAYSTAPINGTNQAVPSVAAPQEATSSAGPELYLFGALRARAVVYNALLRGQFRDSAVRFSDVEELPLLYEFEAGLTASWKSIGITYMPLAGRSPEFKAGLPIRYQTWTSVYLWYRA